MGCLQEYGDKFFIPEANFRIPFLVRISRNYHCERFVITSLHYITLRDVSLFRQVLWFDADSKKYRSQQGNKKFYAKRRLQEEAFVIRKVKFLSMTQ